MWGGVCIPAGKGEKRGGGVSICQVNLIGCIKQEVRESLEKKKISGEKICINIWTTVFFLIENIREDFFKKSISRPDFQ